ncbi:hypothetical protein KY285_006857 [Solanum tuberosum]|nr:hypothetical protein KY285_006857 [Solanum tuberosum]
MAPETSSSSSTQQTLNHSSLGLPVPPPTISNIKVLDTLLKYSCETSEEAWDNLASLYLDQVSFSSIHLKSKFQNFKKGSLSMEDYLQQLHSIACSLRAIGKPLTDDDLVTQALQGLPSSYRTFVSGLNATGSLPTFITLRPLLLTEEAHISTISSEESDHNFVLLVTTNGQTNSTASSSHGHQPAKGHSHGRDRGKNNKGQYGRGRGSNNSSWFNHSFVSNNIPQSFAAMNLEEVHPTFWYLDSGASTYMTNNPFTLTSHAPYSGSSQVMVGDDTLLSINSTGSSILPTTSKPLVLKTRITIQHCSVVTILDLFIPSASFHPDPPILVSSLVSCLLLLGINVCDILVTNLCVL